MSRNSDGKQHALVEACKKAGITVDARKTSSVRNIILTDESGRKYKVSKDLEIIPTVSCSIGSLDSNKNVVRRGRGIVRVANYGANQISGRALRVKTRRKTK